MNMRIAMVSLWLAGCGGTSGGTGANGAGLTCPPSPASAIFTNALCLCGDFHDVGNLVVGPSSQPGAPSVGVNGVSKIINHTTVAGGWVAYGGLSDIGDSHIHGNLVTPEDLDVAGNLEVDQDVSVGKTLTGVGRLKVDGTLRVAGDNRMIGFSQVANQGAYSAPAGPPCPCDPGQLLDVPGAVAAAKSKNDNGSIANIGVTDLTLPTGSYYFGDVGTIGLARLHITGAVSVYVDGDLDSIGAERIKLDPGATLDLYVAGVVRTVGYLNAGDAAQPAAFRLYVGGADQLTLSVGFQKFSGAIYAPKATIAYVGDTIIEGGLFAKDLVGIGNLEIAAAQPSAPPSTTCNPPGNPGGNGAPGGTGGAPSSGGGVTETPPIQ
jgi:hypothetical protein